MLQVKEVCSFLCCTAPASAANAVDTFDAVQMLILFLLQSCSVLCECVLC